MKQSFLSWDPGRTRVRQLPRRAHWLLAFLLLLGSSSGLWAQAPAAKVKMGRFRALLIGIDRYKDPMVVRLKTPIADCRAMQTVLEREYGFTDTISLLGQQATAAKIDATLRELVRNTGETDSLLIYYAGHGVLDPDLGTGAWLAYDSVLSQPRTFINNTDLQVYLSKLPARHVLLISDSCYSGSLFGEAVRSVGTTIDQGYYAKVYRERSRLAMTSGDLTPVRDGGGGVHSVFAGHLLKQLGEQTNLYTTPQELFDRFAPIIGNNEEQRPRCGHLRNVDDRGGSFVFRRTRTVAETRDRTGAKTVESPKTRARNAVTDASQVVVTTQYGNLELWSVAGGELFLNGRSVQRFGAAQQVTLNRLTAGEHRLTLLAPGYEDVRETILIKPGETLKRSYTPARLGNGALDEALVWYFGSKGRVDEVKARTLFSQAAAAGDPRAQLWLARLIFLGKSGMARNEGKAQAMAKLVFAEVKERSLREGSATRFLIANCLLEGLGTSKDAVEGLRILRALGESGMPSAQLNLGYRCQMGDGIPQDLGQAASWYRRAADQGLAPAQSSLALLYEQGMGVPKNQRQAIEWFVKAARKGDQRAKDRLEALGERW